MPLVFICIKAIRTFIAIRIFKGRSYIANGCIVYTVFASNMTKVANAAGTAQCYTLL